MSSLFYPSRFWIGRSVEYPRAYSVGGMIGIRYDIPPIAGEYRPAHIFFELIVHFRGLSWLPRFSWRFNRNTYEDE